MLLYLENEEGKQAKANPSPFDDPLLAQGAYQLLETFMKSAGLMVGAYVKDNQT